MQRNIIPIDDQGMEIIQNISEDFPCALFDADIKKYDLGYVPHHWHENIEIFLVTKGRLTMTLGGHSYVIEEGEGAFINSNIMHTMTSDASCKLLTILFSPALFTGGKNKLYEAMTQVFSDDTMMTYLLSQEIDWQKTILDTIRDILNIHHNHPPFEELIIGEKLSSIWRIFLSHSQGHTSQSTSLQEERCKLMMQYIHENYMHALTLEAIARPAGISTREATRVFKKIIGLAPIKYLMKYRITISLAYLKKSPLNMTQIAIKVGFNSSSYFSKVFTATMGMSPSDYRKRLTP